MKMDSPPTKTKTRIESSHYIFGLPAVLSNNELPTINQIVRYFVQLKRKPNAQNATIIDKITNDILELQSRASIHTVHPKIVNYRLTVIKSKGASLSRSKSRTVILKSLLQLFSCYLTFVLVTTNSM